MDEILVNALERQASEQRLRESEQRYRNLVENSQGLICTHDLEGTLLSVNPAVAHLSGYQPSEMVGRNLGVPHARGATIFRSLFGADPAGENCERPAAWHDERRERAGVGLPQRPV
ncbi:MAG: PAS domain S-box protein [Pyrinomonadaceae bacterium]|nr:PAS domain S-box protein [Pyrinomonadaceae bacterium]